MDIMKVLCVVTVTFGSLNGCDGKRITKKDGHSFLVLSDTNNFPALTNYVPLRNEKRVTLKIKPLNNPSHPPISPQAAKNDELALPIKYSALATTLKKQKDEEDRAAQEAAAQKAYAKEHPSVTVQANALFKIYSGLSRREKKAFMKTHVELFAQIQAIALAQAPTTEQAKPTLKTSVSAPTLSTQDQPTSSTHSESSSISHDDFEVVEHPKTEDDFVDVSFAPNNKQYLVITYQQ